MHWRATRTYPATSPPRWRCRSCAGFDPLCGGLGAEPKFPQPDVYGFMLAYGLLRGAGDPEHVPEGGSALLRPARVHEVVRATLTAMASGGLYDDVQGGFFRYATQRDWSVPHYEKMLEDNARLARLYLEASLFAGDHDLGDPELYRRPARAASTTCWRRSGARTCPPSAAARTPTSSTTCWTRTAAPDCRRPTSTRPSTWTGTRWRRGRCSGRRPSSGARSWPTAPWSCSTYLRAEARHGDAMAHFLHPDGAVGDGAPLLGDQTATAAALLDAYELTGERQWLRRARSLAHWTCEHLCAPDGRLLDRLAAPGECAGLLAQPVPALDENAAMAEVLLRLEAYTGEARLRERALEILAAWAAHYEQYGDRGLAPTPRPSSAIWSGRTRSSSSAAATTPRRSACTRRRSSRRLRCAPCSCSTRPTRPTPSGWRTPACPPSRRRAYVCRGRSCSLFRP